MDIVNKAFFLTTGISGAFYFLSTGLTKVMNEESTFSEEISEAAKKGASYTAKVFGDAGGKAAVDGAESFVFSVYNGVDERLQKAGDQFKEKKLKPIFGEENFPKDSEEYVDITQLIARQALSSIKSAGSRLSDFVSDHIWTISSAAGGTALTLGGVYFAHKAYKAHQSGTLTLQERMINSVDAGKSFTTKLSTITLKPWQKKALVIAGLAAGLSLGITWAMGGPSQLLNIFRNDPSIPTPTTLAPSDSKEWQSVENIFKDAGWSTICPEETSNTQKFRVSPTNHQFIKNIVSQVDQEASAKGLDSCYEITQDKTNNDYLQIIVRMFKNATSNAV